MDNITHALIGAAAAQVIHAKIPSEVKSKNFTTFFYLASVVANNVPDVDIIYSGFLSQPLGHLLHHRGHTHTLAATPVNALAVLTGLVVLQRLLKWHSFTRTQWIWFALVACLGTALHVFADSWNHYGVHPFWPFDNHWYYGDAVFVLEPLIWVSLLPYYFFLTPYLWLRAALMIPLVTVLGLCWFTPPVPWFMAVAVTTLALGMGGASRKWHKHSRLLALPLGCAAFIVCALHLLSHHSWHSLQKLMAVQFPKAQLHDIVLSPMPANPFCWMFLAAHTEGNPSIYSVRRGTFAPFASFYPAHKCRVFATGAVTAQPVTRDIDFNDKIHWVGEFTAPVKEFLDLNASNCTARAFNLFARIPFWIFQPESRVLYGDVRFDRDLQRGFGTIMFYNSATHQELQECPGLLPPWVPPRRDL